MLDFLSRIPMNLRKRLGCHKSLQQFVVRSIEMDVAFVTKHYVETTFRHLEAEVRFSQA